MSEEGDPWCENVPVLGVAAKAVCKRTAEKWDLYVSTALHILGDDTKHFHVLLVIAEDSSGQELAHVLLKWN